MTNTFHIYLVSDSTGETVDHVARACLVQFEEFIPIQHVWTMVRSTEQVKKVLQTLQINPGFVLYTLVNTKNRQLLEDGCREQHVPCISVIDPVVDALSNYLGAESIARPGGQHTIDADYFARIAAMQFALAHDDGQSVDTIEHADIVLLGVSRTSKTPTSIYLANRGLKTANVPIVPGCPLSEKVFKLKHPLVIGLTKDAKRLVEIRRQRLKLLDHNEETDYVNIASVSQEITDARKLFTKHNWPVINVSRKSIEETAATILQIYNSNREGEN